MTHDEMIAVIQAAKAGKTLQYFDPSDVDWRDVSGDYHLRADSVVALLAVTGRLVRVKPEPREWWVVGNPENKNFLGSFYTNREDATQFSGPLFRVREVLD